MTVVSTNDQEDEDDDFTKTCVMVVSKGEDLALFLRTLRVLT